MIKIKLNHQKISEMFKMENMKFGGMGVNHPLNDLLTFSASLIFFYKYFKYLEIILWK